MRDRRMSVVGPLGSAAAPARAKGRDTSMYSSPRSVTAVTPGAVVSALRPSRDSGGSDEAILAIRPRDGAMEAAIFTDGRSVVHMAPRAQAGSVCDDVSKAAAGWARSANTRVQLRPAPAGS